MRNIIPIWTLVAGIVLAMAAGGGVAAAAAGAPVMHSASGSFDVKLVPLAQDAADGLTLGRMAIDKTFTGQLAATSHGEMATATGPVADSAAYVLIERVTGTLDGKAGSFALAHLGIIDRGKPDQRVVIVPDSGTGALAGITGSMTIRIEGKAHFYDLSWTLTPPPPAIAGDH